MIRAILRYLFKPAPPLTLADIDPVFKATIDAERIATERRDMRAVHRARAARKRRVHRLLRGVS